MDMGRVIPRGVLQLFLKLASTSVEMTLGDVEGLASEGFPEDSSGMGC